MKTIFTPIVLFLVVITVGCWISDLLEPTGGTINVSGAPFDLVILQLSSTPSGACCPQCVVSAPVPLLLV